VIRNPRFIAGKADITLTTPDTTIQAIATQGAPFKIIGAQYRKTLWVWSRLTNHPINSPPTSWARRLRTARQRRLGRRDAQDLGVDKDKVKIVPTSTIRQR